MSTTRQKEAAFFKAYQAWVKARHALEPEVAAMMGKVLRHKKSGKLYRMYGHGDEWHMMNVGEIIEGADSATAQLWRANPSEFTIIEEKISEEIPGKFHKKPPKARFRVRRPANK